jgi:hypothetical protein
MTAGKSSKARRHRVLLAADAGSYSITTVNLAVAMAASANTLLQGLFIEDEDLLQVTGLPCSREITLTTATERPLSTDQVQRSLQLVARQFEQALRREAQALQVTWSCETVRGRVRDIGSMAKAEATFTIFARPVSSRLPAGRIAGTRKILVLGNGSPYQQQALEMLLRRPGHERVELTFCDAGGGVMPEQSWRILCRDNEVRLIEFNRGELSDRLAGTGSAFDYAIVSRHEKAEDLRPILDMLRCPVILVD